MALTFDRPAPVRLAAAGCGAFFQRARGWVSIPTREAGFVVGPPNGLLGFCGVRPLGGGLGHRREPADGDRQPVLVCIGACLVSQPTSSTPLAAGRDGTHRPVTPYGGCLGSREDEERSEMRYVMRIAGTSESSSF